MLRVTSPEDAPPTRGLVYFIQARDRDPIKIGRVSQGALLPARVGALQTGSPYPLHVLGVVVGNHEAELHRRFADHRLCGEWFVAHREILEFLGVPAKAAKDRRESADYNRGRAAGYEDGLRDGWIEAGRELRRFTERHCFFDGPDWKDGSKVAAEGA